MAAPLSYAPPPAQADEPFRYQAPALAPLDAAPPLTLAKTRLSNGLTVILTERRGLPVVSAQLVVDRGPRDMPGWRPELVGLAMKALVREQQTAPGANPNIVPDAACGADGCNVSVDCLSGSLDAALGVLAGLAARPSYGAWQQSSLRREWTTWSSATRNSTSGAIETNARALLFVAGDVHAPIPHHVSEALANLTMADLREAHAQIFQPAHATLVVAGDTGLDALAAAAERAFGSWAPTRPTLPLTAGTPPIPTPAARVVLVDHPGELVHAFVVGRAPAGNEIALDAVQLLAMLLSTPKGSLQEQVRSHLGAAYDLEVQLRRGRTGSWFMIGGAFEPTKALPSIRAVLDAVRAARDKGVSARDLEGARARAIASLRAAAGTASGAATIVANTILSGAPPEWALTRHARLGQVAAEDLQRVAQVWLSEQMLWVVIAGSSEHLSQPFHELGLGWPEWRGRSAEPLGPAAAVPSPAGGAPR
jgi:zinc protease